jgi:hypothetical protein
MYEASQETVFHYVFSHKVLYEFILSSVASQRQTPAILLRRGQIVIYEKKEGQDF